jgi:hypothetical protein
MFHLIFQTYVASMVLDIAYIFTHMLQVFYLNVVYVCNGFQVFFHVFLQVFHRHVSSALSIFRRIFQMLHLDVSKVDRVLHMLQ